MEHFIGSFDQFVDHVVEKASRTTLIILDIDQELSIPSTFKRSSVSYLKKVELVEIIHIDTLQKLFVYLSNVQVEKTTENIAVWNLPSENIILSKLTNLENTVILGHSKETDLSNFKKWI